MTMCYSAYCRIASNLTMRPRWALWPVPGTATQAQQALTIRSRCNQAIPLPVTRQTPSTSLCMTTRWPTAGQPMICRRPYLPHRHQRHHNSSSRSLSNRRCQTLCWTWHQKSEATRNRLLMWPTSTIFVNRETESVASVLCSIIQPHTQTRRLDLQV